jgi:hypothetical protein
MKNKELRAKSTKKKMRSEFFSCCRFCYTGQRFFYFAMTSSQPEIFTK